MKKLLVLVSLCWTLFTPLVVADTVLNELEIQGVLPVLTFNDTTVADGLDEWQISGSDDVLYIFDVAASDSWLIFNRISNSINLGRDANAAASGSMSLGGNSEALGSVSSAVGWSAKALGFQHSTAVGPFATANDSFETAVGSSAATNGSQSTALGYASDARAVGSTAVGALSEATQPWTVILGTNPPNNNSDLYSDVGIGLQNPLAALHIFRDNETQELVYLQSAEPGGAQDRAMMYLENNGGIRFEFRDTNRAQGWRFQAQTGGDDRFEVTKVGTGEIEYSFRPNGNLFIAGNLFTNSDVNTKQSIEPVSGMEVLEKLAGMPISEWSYKDASQHRHIGPMAQDFHAAFGLGEGDTTLTATDLAGVSLAAIKTLHQQNQQLLAENSVMKLANEDLSDRNQALEQRVLHIERMMARLLAETKAFPDAQSR